MRDEFIRFRNYKNHVAIITVSRPVCLGLQTDDVLQRLLANREQEMCLVPKIA